ncbi:hypothetical protein BU16DRAFT_554205 [Lophium mytilinum]|uniref:Uncharacterized protein n=1 Tax=Lophium mytilinum TaxID=390894 RepID=A0A6A6RC47_9PEZI|nr:hypothetical protein BU16DRAFT_554205 [Lophium mytilinum]
MDPVADPLIYLLFLPDTGISLACPLPISRVISANPAAANTPLKGTRGAYDFGPILGNALIHEWWRASSLGAALRLPALTYCSLAHVVEHRHWKLLSSKTFGTSLIVIDITGETLRFAGEIGFGDND